jgi:hypothetical protein
MKDWQEFFVAQMNKVPFVPSEVPHNSAGSQEMQAHLSKEKYLQQYCYSEAGCTFAILSMLYQPKRITEMGTGWGIRTALLARLNPDAIVYSIELAEDMGGYSPGLLAKHIPNVKFVKGDSNIWEIPEIDLCFIDADHSTESVLLDSKRAYLNRNVDNWCIIWDDYSLSTVKEAVDRFVKTAGFTLLNSEFSGYVFIGNKNI